MGKTAGDIRDTEEDDVVRAKILFAAAEAAPLAKVGGMGDVVGTLPPVLHQLDQDVRLIMPFYGLLSEQISASEPVFSGEVMGQQVQIYESLLPNTEVHLYLVAHESFAPQRVYGGTDENWRFTLFANTVVEFAQSYEWQPNIIHCHDWHTGLIPAWIHQCEDIGTVYTIHNLAYQGPSQEEMAQIAALPPDYKAHNAMAGGIMYADQVSTVSPTYAQEIRTPVHGEGLEGLLDWKADRLQGILNGIDMDQFDPAHDDVLPQTFTAETLAERLANKTALQAETGLQANPEVFLVGMVSRLVEQKGLDLVLQIIDQFLAYSDAQLVVLGSGEAGYEQRLSELNLQFPGRMSYQRRFDPKFAQRIYGGTDAFLMPSRFEPCGISQMIALRYGSVPIVRRTGGLVDTVSHHDPQAGTGTGYCFDRYEPLDLFTCLVRAWEAYRHRSTWRQLQQRGMAQDFSWQRSAHDYIAMYQKIMTEAPLTEDQETTSQSDHPTQTPTETASPAAVSASTQT